jgi:plasmid stabilization system protein ParE
VELALRFSHGADESFALLVSQPDMRSARGFGREALKGVRWFPMGKPFEKHLIFYQRVGRIVEIIRVLHASRDIEGILGEPSGVE